MPVIKAHLNGFAHISNIWKISKSSTSPDGVPKILCTAPSTVGFDKTGYSVDDLDFRIAQDIIGIEQHPICKSDEIQDLFICYINTCRLKAPCHAEDANPFCVKILECLEQDGFQI